jgi:hypothetical protein
MNELRLRHAYGFVLYRGANLMLLPGLQSTRIWKSRPWRLPTVLLNTTVA